MHQQVIGLLVKSATAAVLLAVVGCSFQPQYRQIEYQYIVPPMKQVTGEHQTIAVKVEGENVITPVQFPESERIRLTWIDDYSKADIQVLITLKPSILVHNRNYYLEKTEYDDTRPMKALYHPKQKAHVQTNYVIEITDRKSEEPLLYFQGGKQFYFQTDESDSLNQSESALLVAFKRYERPARNAVVDYLWQNMRGSRYSILAQFKAKFLAERFSLLINHPEYPDFNDAVSLLSEIDKKQVASRSRMIYQNLVDQFNQIPEEERSRLDELLLQCSFNGLGASNYILKNEYEQRLPYLGIGTNQRLSKWKNAKDSMGAVDSPNLAQP